MKSVASAQKADLYEHFMIGRSFLISIITNIRLGIK